MSSSLKKISEATYLLPQTNGMRVPGLVIGNEQLFNEVEIEKPLEQVRNVAYLQGIKGYSIAMPDIHWGYGFPIGGVAAMDAQEGVISPGGVGYDINCGVRLAVVPIQFKEITEIDKSKLLNELFHLIPSGVGHGHKTKALTDQDYQMLLRQGARWSIDQGYGFDADLKHLESYGVIEGADPEAVSRHAKERGAKQLGTIGSGNHFVEIGEIQTLYLQQIAEAWGVRQGQTYILIHSGSRGFGHQVCQDYLDRFIAEGYAKGLPDPQLVCAPIKSLLGSSYFAGMAAAANFAFNNRQQILHYARQAFNHIFGIPLTNIPLIYDVCHNIAKFEHHDVEGKMTKLCVHRKGATRAFGPGHPELAEIFRTTGQPVLVPGDMGRASHLLAGLGNSKTWCSCCHGAGRAMSRIQSMKMWKGKNLSEQMLSQGVLVKASSFATVAEEMPNAYKNVDFVVEAVQEAGLAKKVAKLRPRLVVKG